MYKYKPNKLWPIHKRKITSWHRGFIKWFEDEFKLSKLKKEKLTIAYKIWIYLNL